MTAGRSVSRAFQIGLLCAAGLALFLAGFLVCHEFGPSARRGGPPRNTAEIIERLAGGLPAGDEATLRTAFSASEPKIAALLAQLRLSRAEVRAQLAAQPFDKAALAAAMKHTLETHEALAEAIQSVILQTIDRLSPDGRTRLWRGRRER